MTKPETEFADDDLAMARRAAWLLQGHAPGREQPPLDLDLGGLNRFVGMHGGLTPLAHFALARLRDADRGARQLRDADEAGASLTSEPLLRNAARAEACRHEKRAAEQLRGGEVRITNAFKEWVAASEARADDYAGTSAQFLTGEHHAVLGELLAIVERLGELRSFVERSLRQLALEGEADPFPSAFGLTKAARNLALDDQALCLVPAGHSLEEIAYVMGWYYGDVAQIERRTGKRLKEAEERRRGEPEPSNRASDMAWNFSGFP